jgi:protein-tyrosine phosphatase
MKVAGVDVLVSMLTPGETRELGLSAEAATAVAEDIEFASFPIEDRGVPESLAAFADLLEGLRSDLIDGRTIAVHCRSGIGRSSLLAASLLVTSGVDADPAFQLIEKSRGLAVPDTAEQREWVGHFAAQLTPPKRVVS